MTIGSPHHLSSHTSFFFFFNDTATTEIYTLSLHDALPILGHCDTAAALGVDIGASEHADLERGIVGKRDPDVTELARSEEHTSELQSQSNLVCRLLLEKKKIKNSIHKRRNQQMPAADLYTE